MATYLEQTEAKEAAQKAANAAKVMVYYWRYRGRWEVSHIDPRLSRPIGAHFYPGVCTPQVQARG